MQLKIVEIIELLHSLNSLQREVEYIFYEVKMFLSVDHLPEQKLHWSSKCFKVDQVIDGSLMFNMTEDSHPDNCIDKSDESQQGPDIE